jgi:hypothetical protein
LVPQVIKLDLVADLPMDARNRYFGSAWRRDTGLCPGGFFMDSSVHFTAALRHLAAAAGGGEAAEVSATALQVLQPAASRSRAARVMTASDYPPLAVACRAAGEP